MCDVLDKVESRGIEKGIAKGIAKGIKKSIRPLAVPPPRFFFCPPIFPLICSKMPSRSRLKLLNKTKKKMGIE